MQSILNFFITFIYLTLRYIIKNTDSYNDVYKFVRSAERLNYDAAASQPQQLACFAALASQQKNRT